MKPLFALFGLLIILTGVLPLLNEIGIAQDFLKFMPAGANYNILIIVLGALVFYFSIKKEKQKKV